MREEIEKNKVTDLSHDKYRNLCFGTCRVRRKLESSVGKARKNLPSRRVRYPRESGGAYYPSAPAGKRKAFYRRSALGMKSPPRLSRCTLERKTSYVCKIPRRHNREGSRAARGS